MVSSPDPAVVGTTMVTGFAGQVCAATGEAAKSTASVAAARR